MASVCPFCKDSKNNLPNHWRLSSCDRVPYHPHHIEVIEGLLLSDGTITSYPPTSKFQIGSTNKEFLEWLSGVFGLFSGDVCLSETSDQIAHRNRETGFSPDADSKEYSDYYRLRTMADNRLNGIRDRWYVKGEKKIPNDFQLTSRSAKMWYIGDGHIRGTGKRRQNRVAISNRSFDVDRCISILREQGFYPTSSGSNDHLLLSVSDTQKFFDYIGSPVPGFEYKWDRKE